MIKLTAFMLLLLAAIPTIAKEPVYVGGGRYMCSDNTPRCAEIRQRNDEIEARDRERRERNEERENERARERDRERERSRNQ